TPADGRGRREADRRQSDHGTVSRTVGAFSAAAYRIVPNVDPPLVRRLRNACVAIGRALEPLDVADTDIAVAGGPRFGALLVKLAAVLRARRRGAALAHEEHRGAGADGQEPSPRVARRPDHDPCREGAAGEKS